MLQLLGQGLRLKEMQQMLRKLRETAAESHSEGALGGLDNSVGLNLCVAQVASMLGKMNIGRRALSRAEAALLEASPASASTREFDHHRRQELAREASNLRNCLPHEGSGEAEPFDLIGGLGRTFAFPAMRGGCGLSQRDSVSQDDSNSYAWVLVSKALRCSFGIEECFKLGLCTEEAFEKRLRRCFSRNGMLRWPRVFGPSSCPTKLEVCSGTGDWVVAQAQAETGRTNWLSSELRFDRVQSILTKMIFGRVNNLGLFAGDASWVLRNHIPANSLANVCVNFPEPPQTNRNASCDDAEAELHLLTPEFFLDIHAALVETGVLTIYSDNRQYIESLAGVLGNLRSATNSRAFLPFGDVPNEHLMDADEFNGILVLKGTPGPEVGHAVATESYFDRFFQHGQHNERYYIAVSKS